MKNFSTKAFLAVCAIGMTFSSFAGNKDRNGQAGAPEMLINPWARTTGVFGMNSDIIFINSLRDFFVVLSAMVLTGLILIVYFRRKKWL
jgi:hypothetical protein